MGKVNRNFRASVFTHLFAEPEKERGLYNAFSTVALPPDASEVINMLAQEWDWDKAFEINARDTERRVNEQWEGRVASIVADKDAALADMGAALAGKDAALAGKDAIIAELKAQLSSQPSPD